MSTSKSNDAVVVGSGPNGLAAALVLAQAGLSVLLLEQEETLGGGLRTEELTLPGFRHDVCSAVHPLAVVSPFFRSLPLEAHGLSWVEPPLPLAHPLDGAHAVRLHRSVKDTAEGLGKDEVSYRRLLDPLVAAGDRLMGEILGPVGIPRHPVPFARLGLPGLLPAAWFSRWIFREPRARSLFCGLAAHSLLPLERAGTTAFGLVLALCFHQAGGPFPRGGAQALADALVSRLRELGGEVRTGHRVTSLADLPPARAVLFDVAPRRLVAIAGSALPSGYRRRLERFQHGPGAFKMDWALDGPIPWLDPACAQASTLHLGGSSLEIAESERAPWAGRHAERPFVLLTQPTRFDPTRAPAGRHVAWAYCHVPHGSPVDMTDRIEAQVERFAPGFRDRVLARHAMNPAALERHNPNYVGGDIAGGASTLGQIFSRPVPGPAPYATPNPKLFLCSASTPPGGGVHGMCGYHAARTVLARVFGRPLPRHPAGAGSERP